MKKNILISIAISIGIIGGTMYYISEKSTIPEGDRVTQSPNVEIKDGIQYVTITAQGGYSPLVSVIEPNLPTKLIVKTNGTYDCSASLVIHSADFQKILQPTGEEVIDLGMAESGETIQGLCGMGMYRFQLQAN